MKVPNWFLVGCGLLVLNALLVLGGVVSRHASAVAPDESQTPDRSPANEVSAADAEAELPRDASSLSNDPEPLPSFPSLDTTTQESGVLTLEDFKDYYGSSQPINEVLAPLDEARDQLPAAIADQLSHNFFDSVRLRLQSTERLNQAALGLVEEAAILFQRGDVKGAKELLRTATQLRETTAKLLVTHQ